MSSFDYEPKDIFLVADKIRVGRVISNLLNNAIKFTSRGEITISITELKHDDDDDRRWKYSSQY